MRTKTFKNGKSKITYKDLGLEDFAKALKEANENLKIKVGILGDGNIREGEQSNAEIGVRHELGLGVPVRSFLRAPLINNFKNKVEESGGFDQKKIKNIIKKEGIVLVAKKLALLAEETIQDAFDTGGDGKWTPSDMSKKKNHQTLVESQQLRNSITSEVVE